MHSDVCLSVCLVNNDSSILHCLDHQCQGLNFSVPPALKVLIYFTLCHCTRLGCGLQYTQTIFTCARPSWRCCANRQLNNSQPEPINYSIYVSTASMCSCCKWPSYTALWGCCMAVTKMLRTYDIQPSESPLNAIELKWMPWWINVGFWIRALGRN